MINSLKAALERWDEFNSTEGTCCDDLWEFVFLNDLGVIAEAAKLHLARVERSQLVEEFLLAGRGAPETDPPVLDLPGL